MNMTGNGEHPVPPDVWENQEMRTALAGRDISSVYRLLRRHGVSQRQIAALTGQSQSEVSEILKGRQVMAYDVLARIAGGLRVPRGFMGLAYDEATATNVVGISDDVPAEEEESVKRRRFLAHAATVTFGAAVLGTGETQWLQANAATAAATPVPGRVGMTDVRQVVAATKALRALDYQYGGGACRDAVVAQLSWASQMLKAQSTDVVRKKLFEAVADLHNLAGWTSFDIDMLDAARNHFGQALELAKRSENEALVANVLYRMGRVYLHHEAPNDALKLFQLGQVAAQQSGSELAVAVLCANEAWAYASMPDEGGNNEQQAQRMIARARSEFERASDEDIPDWVRFFTETDLHAMIGTVFTVLSASDVKHSKIAIPHLERALGSYSDDMNRSRVFNLAALATNHLREGDVDQGARVGRKAVDLAEGVRSSRVSSRMQPLAEEARKRPNNADSRDLAERISLLGQA
jgi:transcriptional regulator with XRE-family HTH domain